jgi:hypothetical protein
LALAVVSLACHLPSLSAVRRFTATPRPSQAAGASATIFPVPPTETPLGQFGPSATPGPPGTPGPSETPLGAGLTTGTGTATGTGTPTPTATPTATAPAATATSAGGTLVITDVQLLSVRRDATRDNGAIATVQVFFTGGRGPYRFFDEGAAKPGNPFEVATTCGASLVHTASVHDSQGQTAGKAYFANILCPAG